MTCHVNYIFEIRGFQQGTHGFDMEDESNNAIFCDKTAKHFITKPRSWFILPSSSDASDFTKYKTRWCKIDKNYTKHSFD